MRKSLSAEQRRELDAACIQAKDTEGAPLLNVGLAVYSAEDIEYEGYFGLERPGRLDKSGEPGKPGRPGRPMEPGQPGQPGEPGGTGLAFGPETRLRAASLSKHAVIMGLMRLVERGKIDLEADISDCLGFRLRHPLYPHRPIALWMLPSHCSSLRDADYYFPPLGVGIAELFEDGSEYFQGGEHFASPAEARGADLGPGSFYSYCNLGYSLIGSIIERAAGKRFDLYMDEEVFKPLGIEGGFNPGLLSDRAFARLAPIHKAESWKDGEPVWKPQVDDYASRNAGDFVRKLPGSKARLSDYELGSNGALFSPQGGMRINLRGLCRLAQTILGYGSPPRASPGVSPGTSPGARLLSPGSVAAMLRPRWLRGSSWAGGPANAEPGTERTLATGLGLVLSSRKAGEKPLWGHHGSAYGFLGGIYFDTKAGWGYAYMIGGTSRDPEAYCPGPGALNHWEARLRSRVEKLIPWT